MPKVSVILPTHNGARFLARAVASVQAQTVADFELIIIIDGSSDGSQEIAQALSAKDQRIRIISFETNQGIQKALATGLQSAGGDYIARIDDDDIWTEGTKLERQLDYFSKNPECVLLGTGLIVQNDREQELYRFLNPQTDAEIREKILYRNCFSHSTVMFKASAARQAGGYAVSESTRHVEDYDLWLKLGMLGSFANLPDYAVGWTVQGTSLTGKHKLLQFKNHLAITAGYKGKYPHFTSSRLKSRLRLAAYWLFGSLVPMSIQNLVIKSYKQS